MGPVQEFAGLNSFFQGYARRDQTLQKLEQRRKYLSIARHDNVEVSGDRTPHTAQPLLPH
jgi:hypothetical protein